MKKVLALIVLSTLAFSAYSEEQKVEQKACEGKALVACQKAQAAGKVAKVKCACPVVEAVAAPAAEVAAPAVEEKPAKTK
ncbi:MAG: hypothetical protein A2381_09475 [Bdellovibrionales bacterium RIFOXYB1_FULL_37_110]|nr:MAG: hypothetical protein A2417_03020 [Bdellovibrionales bacterium RIFOXYC1_FULL_37_79]OFZ59493.1 MAG: hypothetical protein A2381_09475 [Bdellovibrionales bacterium RIFOXYB1_FULL_37_110]OFZ64212.1 MAG: hypothetical protein A2577_12325 [Bdellovibrionales bacterium RIFOXYD1_FULL_36_51]